MQLKRRVLLRDHESQDWTVDGQLHSVRVDGSIAIA